MDEDFGELERAASASRLEVKVGASYGSQSMVDPLRTVLVRRPDEAFAHADPKIWGYTGRPDLIAARTEHAALVEMLRSSGAEVWYHEEPQEARADAIFVHDPVLVTDRGAIVLRMGKELRRGEEASIADSLTKRGVPILGTLRSPATAEGGDLLWINHDRLAVGQGFRTNAEGLRQLKALLKPLGVRTEPVPLPFHTGPAACLHLMSLISLVDDDLAVVYPRLLPVPFWQRLQADGIDFLDYPDAEHARMAHTNRPQEGAEEGGPGLPRAAWLILLPADASRAPRPIDSHQSTSSSTTQETSPSRPPWPFRREIGNPSFTSMYSAHST